VGNRYRREKLKAAKLARARRLNPPHIKLADPWGALSDEQKRDLIDSGRLPPDLPELVAGDLADSLPLVYKQLTEAELEHVIATGQAPPGINDMVTRYLTRLM
jgi:hypothetical protein